MKNLHRFTDWLDDDKTQKIFWYVIIAVTSAPILFIILNVLLDDFQLILLGAGISLVSSGLITRVLIREEKERRQSIYKKRHKNRLPEIFDSDFSHSLKFLGDMFNLVIYIQIVLVIGFVIFLFYLFIMSGVLMNIFLNFLFK